MKKPKLTARQKAFRQAAYEKYHQEGEIEIDLDPPYVPTNVVSMADENPDGAYVLAWVWVANEDLPGYARASCQASK